MKTSNLKRAAGLVAVLSAAWGPLALAGGTNPGTPINNTATVDYAVAGVTQTQVSSPVAGFVVDRKIDLNLIETNTNYTTTVPSATSVVTTFKLTNTGNGTQGYEFSAAQGTGTLFGNADAFDMTLPVGNVRVSSDLCSIATTTTPTFAGEVATTVPTLAKDTCVYVFVLATTPSGALNAQASNVRLTAITREATTLADLDPQAAADLLVADNPATVQIVYADSGVGPDNRNGRAFADDQYYVQTASLAATKTAAVQTDALQTSNPKAIPGATVEYTIVVTNSGSVPADGVSIGDAIPANTTFVCGSMTLNGSPVADPVNCATSPPISVGATLPGATQTLSNVAPANTATFVFRVTIN